jgi:hypothetical protein
MEDRFENVDQFATCSKATWLIVVSERGGPTVMWEAHVAVHIKGYSVTSNRRYNFRVK